MHHETTKNTCVRQLGVAKHGVLSYSGAVIADTMVDSEARGFCFNPLVGNRCVSVGEQRPRAFARSETGSASVPESDSDTSKKRCCCIGPEIPHKRVAKIAPLARMAVGCHSSALGTFDLRQPS